MTVAVVLVLGTWLTWIDSREYLIPDSAILLGFAAALLGVLTGFLDPQNALMGMVIAGLQFLLVYVILPGKLGLGDVKYAILLGTLLGPWGWIVCTAVGFSAALIYIVLLVVSDRDHRDNRIPLAPFLTIGSWGAIIGGYSL